MSLICCRNGILAALMFCVLTPLLHAQVFQNLGFEQAAPVYTTNQPEAGFTIYPPALTTSALPDWTAELGDTPVSVMWGEPDALDETSVQLVGASFNSANDTYGHGSGALQGQYSVDLYAFDGGLNVIPGPLTASISQTGQIPVGDKSVQFLMSTPYANIDSTPYVTFNGNAIALTLLSTQGGVTTMSGDISAYSGMTGTLTFLAKTQNLGSFFYEEDDYILDSISFSTASAPEPLTWAMVAGGLGLLALSYRRLRTV